MLADPLFELIPLANVDAQVRHLPEHARVSITASPNRTVHESLDLAARLLDRGFRVTPHLSASVIATNNELRGVLARIDALEIESVFVVGGDGDRGSEIPDGVALVKAIDELTPALSQGVPCYPEGHPDIKDEVLAAALSEKAARVEWMTSQMTFDSAAVVDWTTATRASGVELPLVLGVAGVVDRLKLMRISARIGVGPSLRFLRKNTGVVSSLVRPGGYDPTRFLADLAPDIERLGITGLHIYTFNDCQSTEAWRRGLVADLA